MYLDAVEKDNTMSVKVYYVYHSCFILEFDSCYMMFDYYKHYDYNEEHDFDFDSLIKTILESNKPFYIFASHSHSDHFNKKIFEFDSSNTFFILSDDIKLDKASASTSSNIRFIGLGNTLKLGNLTINAFSSTDLGVSFMIEVEKMVIFHAGDLNWWAWSDDTKEEAEYMENLYKNTVEQIKKVNKSIDIVFFPVDKRLEENYAMGGDYFIKHLKPKFFIPMHFGNEFEITKMFLDKCQNVYPETEIIKITSINNIVAILSIKK